MVGGVVVVFLCRITSPSSYMVDLAGRSVSDHHQRPTLGGAPGSGVQRVDKAAR